ncbi:hypothetical protein [Paraliomyxa miuraensis]|uniref:hypothetical protein n=1 Tax=Paraliomyxa miuraensis TaxID=376150 RepID=UPI00225A2943|nr:hypothetical protein [Paraliomyxa miuraensis]
MAKVGTGRALVVGMMFAGVGCNVGGESETTSFDPTVASATMATSETETGGTGTSAGTSTMGGVTDGLDSSSTAGFVFDVGTGVDVPGTCSADEGCFCNAVDLLFVVDNSGSMQIHHDPIVAAFPLFVDQMINALPPGTDLHVGLTRATGFFDPGNAGGWGGPACEAAITDGVFFPPTDGDNGINGQQGRLFEHDGMRYFEIDTDQDPTALSTWFDGALQGAIDGSAPHSNTETVVAGAAYPFHPANSGPNAGFLRTNAVLVLFLLSDSPDLTPPAIPTDDFVQMVRDAKAECGGDVCVVTSGAIAGACYDQPGNTNTRLYEFMNGFGKPPASWISLEFGMTPMFGNVLGDALADAIATTCDEIVPEG